jgi:hypothetical protein
MLDKTTEFVRSISHSADFTRVHEQGSPVDDAGIGYMESVFKKLGCQLPPSLIEFYRTCNGFTLRWRYKKLTHPDYITSGDTAIVDLAQLLSTLEGAPNRPVLFDYVSDINQVLLRVGKRKVTLHYRDKNRRKTLPIPVDLQEYFRLLDEARALRPWHELLVEPKSFRLEQVRRDKFFNDLKLLFKDADAKLFKRT